MPDKIEVIMQSGFNSPYVPEHTQPSSLFEGQFIDVVLADNSPPMIKICLTTDGKLLIRYATLEDIAMWHMTRES